MKGTVRVLPYHLTGNPYLYIFLCSFQSSISIHTLPWVGHLSISLPIQPLTMVLSLAAWVSSAFSWSWKVLVSFVPVKRYLGPAESAKGLN